MKNDVYFGEQCRKPRISQSTACHWVFVSSQNTCSVELTPFHPNPTESVPKIINGPIASPLFMQEPILNNGRAVNVAGQSCLPPSKKSINKRPYRLSIMTRRLGSHSRNFYKMIAKTFLSESNTSK